MLKRLITMLLLALVPLVPAGAQAQTRGPVVLAAASLQESLNAAADAWAARHYPRPVLSFAASSALARQVLAGAPADMFISADEDWMNELARARLIAPGSRADLVGNALVLVAPASSKLRRLDPAPGFALATALGGGRLAMADPDTVPAGRYGRQALQALKVWPGVAGQIARAENVRSALALVARGAAPLGIVYATDARAEPGVRVVGVFPPQSHAPITYPLARLAAASHPDAEGFRRFLLSAEAHAIFRRFGFIAR